MVRTQIYLPKNYLDKLKEIAVQEGTTVSDLIRKVISKEIINKTDEKIQKFENSGDWLLSIAEEGKKYIADAPKDLSSNVDKYLYGDK